jgi:hypothetical protein
MRILAHGGTSFSERHRIGAWPSIPREVLESTYGLPGDSMIYGLGVLEDCQPFLVVRLRQVTEIGRSYAYSLLLDPGRDIWTTFDWNTADLLRAILADEVGELLLLRPESLRTEDLKQRLDRLTPLQTPVTPVSNEGLRPASGELFDHWVGAAFSSQPIVVTPSMLGFAERPTYEQLIKHLYQFEQPCFRIGAGWLVGASGEHAAALGANLVIDDQLDADPGSLTANAQRGREAAEAWLTIAQHQEFSNALLRLKGVPICEWTEVQGSNGVACLTRLKLLAELLKGDRVPDQLQSLEPKFKDFPFLAAEIRRAAHSLMFRGGNSLSPAETVIALRNFYEQGLEIGSADQIRRLDPGTLIHMVVDRELQNGISEIELPLPPEVEATVFKRLLGAILEYSDIPQLLITASEFMVQHFNGTRREMWLTELKEAVEIRTKITESPLSLWETFPKDHVLWQDVSEMLKKAVWDRAKTRNSDWELEYLRFGKDSGGAQLSRNGIDSKKVTELIDCYLHEVNNQTDLAGLAKDWLAELAKSKLRLTVRIAEKVTIAESQISENWLPFLRLWAAYNDSPEPEINRASVNKGLTPDERNRLTQELYQMLQQYPPRTQVPNLPRMVKLLDELPLDFFNELRKFRRELGTAAFARWIAGLRELGHADLASMEIVCFCEESKEALPEDWFFRGFNEQMLEVLIDFLLFGGYASDDELHRHRCEEVLSTRYHLPRLRKIVARVCYAGLKQREKLENFVRRYAAHEPALVRLFACFSPTLRQNIVAELALRSTDAFIKHARDIVDETYSGKALNTYRYAVLTYVRKCDPEWKKKIVRLRLLTRHGLDAWLDSVLESEVEDIDESSVSEPEGEKANRESEVPLYSTAQATSATTSHVEESRDAQHPPVGKNREELRSSTRPGLGQKVRSLIGSVFSAEPPPELDLEESNSTPSHVKKDDS